MTGAPLGRFVLARLLRAVPLLAGVIVISFTLIHLAPGEPIYMLAGDGGSAAYYDEMRARYGLDRSLPEQLVRYGTAVASGDLGYSFTHFQPVTAVILERVPATLLLMLTAIGLASALGLVFGVVAACGAPAIDRAIVLTTSVTYAVPVFWLGQLLVLSLAAGLGWFPVAGMTSNPNAGGVGLAGDVLHHLALPATTLALSYAALTTRLTRAGVRDALGERYVVAARSRGVPGARLVWRHAVPNALLPLVTVIGQHLGLVLTGAALTETVFAWPGLGRLLLSASLQRDYPVVLAILIVASVTVVLVNLATDVLYATLDPRVDIA